MRRAAKRDGAEPEIVAALERAGFTVLRISQSGIPDLFVLRGGRVWLLEVKSRPTRITPAQRRFDAASLPCPFAIVSTPAEALAAVGVSKVMTAADALEVVVGVP